VYAGWGGGGAPTGVGEDNREAEGRGSRTRRRSGTDDVDAWAEATTHRPAGWQGVRRAAAAEPWRSGRTTRRSMGRRPMQGGAPEAEAGRGGSRSHFEGRRRRTGGMSGGDGVGGSVDGGFWEAGGGGEYRGAEDGGRCGSQRSGRMTTTEEEEDTSRTMVADQGRKSGQVLGGRCFYI
jgi:hypothetical protein